MTFYWVEFTDRKSGTIETDVSHYPAQALKTTAEQEAFREKRDDETEAEIRERGAKFGTLRGYSRLPYPANPRLDVRHECPSFCYRPNQCKGRTSCPTAPSCTS